jgi:hypothetical protein
MSNPRRHHFVPRFLLANFTETGDAEGFLHIHDLERGQHRVQRPKEVAHERDFYRVEIVGKDPAGFEKAMGLLEDRAAPIIRSMQETWQLPNGADLVVLIEFAAYLAVRVPKVRKRMLATAERMAKEFFREASASPEQYAASLKLAREEGRPLPDIGIDKVRRLAESVIVEGDQTGLVSEIPKQADRAFDDMSRRRWSLIVGEPNAPAFVCSDAPMSAFMGAGTSSGGMWLPLSPRLAFVSDPTVADCGEYEAPRKYVAFVNRVTAMGASRVFAPRSDFIWLKDNGKFGHAVDAYRHS